MNCGFIVFFLIYFTSQSIHAQPSGTRQHSEIIFGNSGRVRTSGPFELGAYSRSESFSDGSDTIQSVVPTGKLPHGAARYPGARYYSSQYLSNRYDPTMGFPGASLPFNQNPPFQNSYGSGYSNPEYYPVTEPCGPADSHYEYFPAHNTIHRETPSHISINKPYLKGHSYDSGLNIWTTPNGVKASRSTGFDYKLDLKF